MILIDLIGLKPINDEHGHSAGDQLIVFVAEALRASCREQDQVFRFGGDEFVILCLDETGEGAKALIQRIEKSVKGKSVSLVTDQGTQFKTRVELSVGLASSDQVAPEDVLKRADELMYEDKKRWYEGRERYR